MMNEQLSQGLSIAAVVSPQTLNGSSGTSGAVDMSKFKRVMAVVKTHTNSGSLTAKFQASATSGGSYADVTGTTITAITAADKQATIEMRSDQMPAGTQFLKLVLTEGNSANCVCDGVVLGGEAAQKPASQYDPAAVVQRLVL